MSDRIQDVEQLFKSHFKPLCGFAVKYITDPDGAKDIVHEVFISLWEKWGTFDPGMNHRAYLYTSVRNRCLNHIRDRKKTVDIQSISQQAADEANPMEAGELAREIQFAIQSLPEKCRIVFEMSRFEGLRYNDIAEKMGISVKTVEAHMTKALSIMREHLGKFMLIIFSCVMM